MGESKQAGNPMSIPDGQIAAIALANDYTIATRNIKGFSVAGNILTYWHCPKTLIINSQNFLHTLINTTHKRISAFQ